MPHVSIEYSKNLEQTCDIQGLCNRLFVVLADHDEFDPSALKIRAKPVEFFRIGTEPQSFAHATLLLLGGRTTATRKILNQMIADVLGEALPNIGSITVQDIELSHATYIKKLASH